MIRSNSGKIVAACFIVGMIISGTGSTSAFFSDSEKADNIFAVGENLTEIQEDFPEPSPIHIKEDTEFRKKVVVNNPEYGTNHHNTDSYVRVYVSYSNWDVGKAISLENLDTANWDYNESDGFYYYKHVLSPGSSTTPLFTDVSIHSEKIDPSYLDSIHEFSINIYEESVQANEANYQTAWKNYLSSLDSR